MNGRLALSPRARADLEGIWDFTEERWGIAQAETYARQILRALEIIGTDPAAGQPCPNVRLGYYKYRTGSHLMFYRIVDGVVDIVRILHESMDFERHL